MSGNVNIVNALLFAESSIILERSVSECCLYPVRVCMSVFKAMPGKRSLQVTFNFTVSWQPSYAICRNQRSACHGFWNISVEILRHETVLLLNFWSPLCKPMGTFQISSDQSGRRFLPGDPPHIGVPLVSKRYLISSELQCNRPYLYILLVERD